MLPLLGRLEKLFSNRLVQNILGQRENTIDFREVIEQRRIVLIKLPLKQIEQEARLIGTILVANIHAALFSFVDLPPEQRPGVSLYIDEFQNFATKDIQELLSEGRKFGMRLTVAHQNRSQLTIKELQEATMGAQTIVCFQLTPKDGSELAHVFSAPEAKVKPAQVDPHASETLLNHPHIHPLEIQEFIERYLRPVILQQVGAHGNKVPINNPGYGLLDFAGDMLDTDPRSTFRFKLPETHNPLVYLDYLLQQVMVTGFYLEPIPVIAVRGFANTGVSFWQKVRWMNDNDKRLHADIPDLHIPAHLLMHLPDGTTAWIRPPESANEQLLHFLYHLRLTMRYLAKNPLGTRSQTTNAEVGKMLNQLPPRSAFIRSGKDTGVIYTHDTPAKLPDKEYGEQVFAIRAQTRKTYCRPRDEVERALLGNQAPPPPSSPPEPPPASAGVPAKPPAPTAPAGNTVQPQLSGWGRGGVKAKTPGPISSSRSSLPIKGSPNGRNYSIAGKI